MASYDWINDELARLDRIDLRRRLPEALGRQGPIVERQGRRVVNFASNDYLGLAGDERLATAAAAACRAVGVGRGASPLICGRAAAHAALEQQLAEFEGVEAALLFPSGFAANAGVVPALVGRGDAIYADSANHASLIDGCRLARAATHVYPHADVPALEQLLRQGQAYRRRLVVTDSLFSMDGDLAPLAEIAKLAARYDAMLLVDEAHATGVFGEHGRGVAEAVGADESVMIRVGTLSKALGAAGGFVCGSRTAIEWLANRARTYVFSTAHPAAVAAAASEALAIVAQEPWRRTTLLDSAAELRQRLAEQGWNTGQSASQIIPIVVGSPAAAVELSAALLAHGYWIPAIRPPSVPAGQSLLRLSLSAAHTPEMIAGVLNALQSLAATR
jgi:8-amino-7-oxononanoate synthase